MSWQMRATNALINALMGSNLDRTWADPRAHSRFYSNRNYPGSAVIPSRVRRACNITTGSCLGRPWLRLTPPKTSGRQMIYLHGGTYVNPIKTGHWVMLSSIAVKSGATITVPFYGLAPEFGVAHALPMLRELYYSLAKVAGPGQLVLSGDSAGGGLALAGGLMARDEGWVQPHSLILLAPWLDVSVDTVDASRYPADMVDCSVQAGRWWAKDMSPYDPLVSPIFGDLSDLPPTMIQQGTADVLIDSVRQAAYRMRKGNTPVSYKECEGGVHVYQLYMYLPEARASWEMMSEWMRVDREILEGLYR